MAIVNKNKSEKIKKTKKITGIEKKLTKLQFTKKARTRLYAKLGKFLENSVPLIKALEIVRAHMSENGKKDKKSIVVIIDQIMNEIRNGSTFSNALKDWITPEEVSLLNAGEISGTLHLAIVDLIYMFESQKKIKSALAGLIYPITLVASTLYFIYIFSAQVVPAFNSILPEEKWTGNGALLASLSHIVMNNMMSTLIGTVSIFTLIISTFPYWTGTIRIKFDKYVPWSIYRTVKGCAFLISFAALSKAGIPSPEVLTILGRYATPWYLERINAARRQLLNGAPNIGEALYLTGIEFPDRNTIIDMRSYASLTGADQMMDILSKEGLNNAVSNIQSQVSVLKNIAIVMMGFTFMFIISAMFGLQQQITAAAANPH